ncbi:Translation release factor, codon specific [Blomia tropicalis]|nr:Translation release factor, codon specific [Blomia tropicalis]
MILVMVILCVAFMIVRAIFIPTDYQFDLVWVALADAIFGSLYFYWVAFRIDSGTNAQTKWDVLTSSSSTSSPNSSSNASDIDYIFIKRRPHLLFQYKQTIEEFNELQEIVVDSSLGEDDFKKLAKTELNDIIQQLLNLQNLILNQSVLDEQDVTECTFEIRSGVGGKEAAIFADEMFRLYLKFIEFNGWETRIDREEFEQVNIDDNSSLATSTIEVVGPRCYQMLRHEAGIHRVQRVPKTEKYGRIHTSTVSISVIPVRHNLVVVKDSDLKFEVKNSSGAGGQNVNRNLTCVRCTHQPTGLTVESQETRYQYLNKDIAIRKIKHLLNQIEYDRLEKEAKKQKRLQIGIAARSDKIRTYNYPQNRITDHRLSGDCSSHYNILSYMSGNECHRMCQQIDLLESTRHEELVKQLQEAFESDYQKKFKTHNKSR